MNANYIVLIAVLIIWVGIFLYLVSIDKKVKGMEKGK